MPDYGRGKRPLTDPRRREAQMRADRDAIRAALDSFTDQAIRTLVDRGDRNARGSRMGPEDAGRRSKGDHSDPTFAGANARQPTDNVAEWIKAFAGLLNMGADTLTEAHARLTLILEAPETEWEARVRGDDCRACLRNVSRHDSPEDRLRSGYCPACHQAWLRAMAAWTEQGLPDAPDRVAFERERRQRAAELAARESA